MRKNPLDAQDNDFRALCIAIGFVVVNWAVIEQQIDFLVNATFRDCGGKALRNKGDIPRSLSQKTQFLKDCFKKLAPLKPFAAEGLNLVGRVSNLSTERHDLVHGAITNLEPVNGVFHFRKVEYEKENHAVAPFTFDPPAFSKLETALGDVLTELIAFSQRMADSFRA
jgi:hypothetical protein